MKDEIITLETAKLAKKKGFNIPVSDYINPDSIEENYSAPTQSLLQRWLRETHNTHITIRCKRTDLSLDGFWYVINSLESKMFNTYEQALEEGLYEALKLIKTK